MIFTHDQKKKINEITANEIEIRVKLGQPQILQLLAKAGSEYDEINSISMAYGDFRRESFYVNEVRSRAEDIKKIKLLIIKLDSFDVSFANEVAIDNFAVDKVESVRFKARKRFKMLGGILDFTRVLDIKACTPNIRNNFFNFLKEEALGTWNIEFEVKKKSELEDAILTLAEFAGVNDIVRNQLRELANLMGVAPKSLTVKHLGVNPVMLDKSLFARINLANFVILEKSDGNRAFMKLYDKANYIIFLDGKTVVQGEIGDGEFSLFDCEYMKNGDIKIFDIILHNGRILDDGYEVRMGVVAKMQLPPICEIKKFYPATCENMKKIMKSSQPIDGIIFNEINKPYMHMEIFKWKPADQITFDFLVVPLPDNFKGVQPFTGDQNIYILMSGCLASQMRRTGIRPFVRYKELLTINNITAGTYNPIPFSPPIWREAYVWRTDEKYPSMFVGEFKLNKKEWQLVRIRDDKTLLIKSRVYGNDYFVAEKHINELQNPLTIEAICDRQVTGGNAYFANDKPREYEAMTKFNGYVKYEILQIVTGMNKILDIGSGKGQDIFKYPQNVGSICFVEPDTDAFIELNKRLRNAKFKTLAINDSYQNFIKLPHQFNAVVCNFACHYFLKDINAYAEFAAYCSRVNAEIVILTYMNYDIMKLPLRNEKYEITQKNNQIFVKHHFAAEPYPEFIINNTELFRCMKKEKFNILVRDSFGKFLEFKDLDNQLDQEYVSLYQYVVFRR